MEARLPAREQREQPSPTSYREAPLNRSRARASGRLLLLLVLCAIPASCSFLFDRRSGFDVVNRLSIPVDVIYVGTDGRVTVIDNLAPGYSQQVSGLVSGGQCRNDSLVATDDSGSVVASFPGPVCDGTRWEVGVAVPASSG